MTASCSLGGTHKPLNLSLELHHVIPVAWQQITWQPSSPVFFGFDQDGRGRLWDARTVALCPTHHRNVHAWLVRLMHAVKGEDPDVALAAVKPTRRRLPPELVIANQALVRFTAAGGSLLELVSLREWGAA